MAKELLSQVLEVSKETNKKLKDISHISIPEDKIFNRVNEITTNHLKTTSLLTEQLNSLLSSQFSFVDSKEGKTYVNK